MKIDICCVGKVKESSFREMINEYTKRLSRYANVNIKEVADEKTPDNASSAEEEIIKNKEGARLLNVLKDDSYKIILAIDGKNLSSPELADKIDKIGLSGKSHIQFVIGGSLGLSDDVIKKADMKLSFGRMTFPHQLMRVILLEQIYRSYRIISNEPYHK
ncbi:23S rRNA (pseudouridine1915-N3)-methyltransferase [Eubacterium ruminantium]|uniref:Ribosomal RNA large subunit methyltransferase H n=1 Tax=Eubacterium ruminantium TaxID=42322 RepID=A0A1T4PZF8_9FIRM|nr:MULTISPECIES: 23S rRNA (pseudouridine(1915)-N(3))-methyltransferase RlmH [Eubacterium]MCR5368641.1 23S rRNA (pseudouridine(1915)-N(3))-methyltransferase RlmH [Eubacterium sp.]SCW65184.1 23S rRNA (pseudouridine1915-N3)-methyltransferase [Eubacterium ruminantium]SDN23916.1 23S rRNA (pseudouridine1915-N3)-methyltransferase [Eubacterium ruminantium]SJZ96736.1 23S rRNA (pseudouridine1915-N3)-methyltransferase [Eubacterium ruminantium]